MAGKSFVEVENARKKFIDYIIENMDSKGYLNLVVSNVSSDLNLSSSTVYRYLEHFASCGKLDYARVKKGEYLMHYVSDQENASEIRVDISKQNKSQYRVCPKCGSVASNENARFCWKCGSSLLSEKEQIRDEYHNILGFICRVVKNPLDTKKIMEVLGKVEKLAFGDDI